jgi:ubiquinone/menaquinone biosynthesis C-methylase UbiE
MGSHPYPNVPPDVGEQYERGLVPVIFTPWAKILIARVRPQPGERVLDVACGTGAVARLAAERVGPSGTVVGADASAGMLGAARRVPAALPIEWREADAASLPFADASFDLVLCQQGLQFFPDRVAALREMRRVLGPGGRVGLSVFGTQQENPGYDAIGKVLARYVGPDAGALAPFALGDAELLRGLVEEAGFGRISVRRETIAVHCPSLRDFLERLLGGSPSVRRALAALGEEERRAAAGEYAAALAGYTSEEGFAVPMVSNLVIASA